MRNELTPRILFEDNHFVVIDKPAGLLSQGEKTGDENLVDWLRQYFGRPYVGLVHRLDRNTSGVMVVAKRTKAAGRLTKSLQEGKIYRSYLALVEGSISDPVTWTHWLSKNERTNIVTAHREKREGTQIAKLQGTPRKTAVVSGVPVTLMEIVLETGRSHQIRVQFAFEKHPLVGDPKYGSGKTISFGRPALHSWRMEFPHPIGEALQKYEAPLPEDFRSIVTF